MSRSPNQGKVVRILAFAVLLVCAVWQIIFALQEQRSLIEGVEKTLTSESRNFRTLTHQGKQKHMLEADLPAAMSLVKQALIVNPNYVPAWLSLAELNNDLGEKEKASRILHHVDVLTEGVKRWRWDKALTAYQLGKLEMLPQELRFIIRELGGKNRNDALRLAFSLWGEPAQLLENIGQENISHLLGHAVRNDMVKQAVYFWQIIEDRGLPRQKKDALALIDMLLKAGEMQVAIPVWRNHFNPDKLFFNGDFSQPFIEQAFGWRTGKKNNFDQIFEKDPQGGSNRILHYRFKGWANINFMHLSQIVPLENGRRYTLTAEMKSQKMTTNERPFLEVSGYKCKMPSISSDMVAPDQDWQQYRIVLEVPEECSAVVVRLRRKESKHIDSKLAGHLWLRNFNIYDSAEDSPFPNQSKQ